MGADVVASCIGNLRAARRQAATIVGADDGLTRRFDDGAMTVLQLPTLSRKLPMPTLLLKNADVVLTMDGARRELAGGYVLIDGPAIVEVGPADEAPADADEVIDMAGHVLLPGLVNTHHHMYQSLTRAVRRRRMPISSAG